MWGWREHAILHSSSVPAPAILKAPPSSWNRQAGAFLALDIVRGERIFTRDATDTDRFELSVLRRAGDLVPFERQRQRLLLDPPL